MDHTMSKIKETCEQLVEAAFLSQASDIHFVPKGVTYVIYFHHHLQREEITVYPSDFAIRLITYFKFQAELDISDRRRPQSGSFTIDKLQQEVSFRLSTIPAIDLLESVVIRCQYHNRIVPLNELCSQSDWEQQLKKAVHTQQGLIFLTGATGTGKTTTLYSMTAYATTQLGRRVITLEDPVENRQAHLLQVQVNERAGMTYATGLKAILRHSPDVIMIGEIRDAETARVAVEAALTGHLVLTTVHAKNPIGCLYRMIDFAITVEELRQTIICVASQQLIKRDEKIQADFTILSEANLEQAVQMLKPASLLLGDEEYEVSSFTHTRQ